MTFNDLQLAAPILKALSETGYTQPTPIQEQAIPHVLKQRDILGCAQTGTGKTAAFACPIIHLLDARPAAEKRNVRTLILTPTRELAIQIGESFAEYGQYTSIKHTVIFGGVGQDPQVKALQRGVDVLIATPGRLLDLINQKHVNLKSLEIFVLDEADRMLDMGFIHDVKKVLVHLPQKRQSLFFSATMAPEIVKLANTILVDPIKVEVTPAATTALTINQTIYFVDKNNKKFLLMDILNEKNIERALVFSRTKHGANRLAEFLSKQGIKSHAIHGNKSQTARQTALSDFKNSKTRILVATDIAARGIDIDDLTHVINYELPNVPEQYVHRIGRTGRAGVLGIAIGFCDAEEKPYLKSIQKLIGLEIPVVAEHDYPLMIHEVVKEPRQQRPPRNKPAQSGSRGQGNSGSTNAQQNQKSGNKNHNRNWNKAKSQMN
jgi:ATP-dependent RNA helicase RhlE